MDRPGAARSAPRAAAAAAAASVAAAAAASRWCGGAGAQPRGFSGDAPAFAQPPAARPWAPIWTSPPGDAPQLSAPAAPAAGFRADAAPLGGAGPAGVASALAAAAVGAASAAAAAAARGSARAAARRGGRQARRLRRSVALFAAKEGKNKANDLSTFYTSTVLLPETDFQPRGNAKVREPQIQALWKSKRLYERLLEREAPLGKFCIHDGPPYANGSLHMGHALNKILKDAINKFKSAQGYSVRYIPGWDCHGLPIELKVLQSLKSKERRDLTPLKLRARAAEFAREAVAAQRESFERYGVWGEFDDPYLTLLPKYEAAQLGIFEEMVRGGHIYRGRKPVYWSPSTRTALAEAELEYPEEHTSRSIYVAFKATGALPEALRQSLGEAQGGLEVGIWTTTPWTIPANRAVAINPNLEYAVVQAEWPEGGGSRRLIVARDLVETLQDVLGASMTVEVTFEGKVLDGLTYEHPISGASTPVVVGGDYITTESGTGLVHTAPGHGMDDFIVGQKYGLEVAAPVDDKGDFTSEVGLDSLVGANVLKDANQKIIDLLQERGLLLREQAYKHKYPYDWRSKKPVIFRATPQWFASIDGLRTQVLDAVSKVEFIPAKQSNRMRPMLENRSDWCISRQRSWGVPIPAFYKKDTNEELLTPEIVRHVREIVAEKGTNAWFELPVEDLLPEEYKADAALYEKGTDTMDVWFDSGSSWAAVREELGSPVDLYLEGSDQHRGWFQSSLITSVAVQGCAPYKTVMTHGFTVDENGRKMSKSVGNVMDPKDIIEGGPNQKKQPAYGADTLRLWACSCDFSMDMTIGQGILKSTADSVVRIRNRARFMLGNLHDFDPATDSIAFEKLPLLDQHTIAQAEEAFAAATKEYETYTFSKAMASVNDLLGQLSAVYLDLAKDRLYILAKDDLQRRSCQTVLHWLVQNFAKVISPVLCHMAEDIWSALPGDASARPESVFLAGWWSRFPGCEAGAVGEVSEAVRAYRFALRLRDTANLALEEARKAGAMKGPMEARMTVILADGADGELRRSLELLQSTAHFDDVDSLRWIFGVSAAEIGPAEGEVLSTATDDALGATVSVTRAPGRKCERCWVICPSVGSFAGHPQLCGRCCAVLESLGIPEQPAELLPA